MDDGRNDSLFRTQAWQHGVQISAVGGAYQPHVPGWTRHGLAWLGAIAVLLLVGTASVTAVEHVRIRVSILAQGDDLIVVVPPPLPEHVALVPGTELRFVADGQNQTPRSLRLDRQLDESAHVMDVAGVTTASNELAFTITFVDDGSRSHRSAHVAVGVLIVPAGELTLWQYLGRWL